MKPGTLVRVVHPNPQGSRSRVPVWGATPPHEEFRGYVHHGGIFLMVKAGLRDGVRGLASVVGDRHVEIIHPEWGVVLINGVYLEAVDGLS